MQEAADHRDVVLVVEDHEDIRDALSELLEQAGYAVIAVADGAAALAHLRAAPAPSLILLDVMMPVMDGWSFLVERRQDTALASIPVVLCTAVGGPSRGDPYDGVAAVLAKPLDADAVLAAVQRYAVTRAA